MKGEARPFDRVIKQIFGRPRVLLRLCKDYIGDESGYFRKAKINVEDLDQPITWVEDELRPEQALWRADKIARLGESSVIHVEQQTQHNASIMLTRMMHYATYISSFYDFEMNLLQVYYYTGDRPIDWPNLVRIDNHAILNQFRYIDAGEHDAWKMLRTNNVDYAVLGLLARRIDREDQYIKGLISLVRSQNEGSELIKALVGCVMVACLRRRDSKVLGMLSTSMQASILQDPIIRQMSNPDRLEANGRIQAGDFYHRTQRLKRKVRGRFPASFLDWVLTSATPSEMESLEGAAETAKSFAELVEVAQVSWNSKQRKLFSR